MTLTIGTNLSVSVSYATVLLYGKIKGQSLRDVAISKSPRGRVRPVCHSASRVRREEKQFADDTDADADCGSHCMSLNGLSQREETQSGEG